MVRRSRVLSALALLVAAGALLLLSSCGNSSHGAKSSSAKAHASAHGYVPYAVFNVASPHVRAGVTVYGRGQSFQKPGAQDDPPLEPAVFDGPVAAYKAYASAQVAPTRADVARLESALQANDRAGAKQAWRAAFAHYLRLGGVYLSGDVGELDGSIDGLPGGLPGGASNAHFSGFHRIELGLWSSAQPQRMLPWARRLDADLAKLPAALRAVEITPLEYATRAHEVLEDAQRDLLSGTAVPLSGEGVLGTKAGLEATEAIFVTLRHTFRREAQGRVASEAEFANFRRVLSSVAAAHGGRLPSNFELSSHERELIDGSLGGVLEALSTVPDELSTEGVEAVKPIPSSSKGESQ
ncbi:MAG TPA: EfeM/EfeO family lipoprotein [Solirubrobacteraceae bacterium]|jgi:iron uptake system EfeUOB component EfeO/EfeM|nr:EfeM/EfeO family lipoprotein [Solirubrobacteraceae bacterium]